MIVSTERYSTSRGGASVRLWVPTGTKARIKYIRYDPPIPGMDFEVPDDTDVIYQITAWQEHTDGTVERTRDTYRLVYKPGSMFPSPEPCKIPEEWVTIEDAAYASGE